MEPKRTRFLNLHGWPEPRSDEVSPIPYSGLDKEKQRVSKKDALQSAADEARKAARAAREFAGLLDDYAKYLTQPNFRQRADDTHHSALNKLKVINEGLAVCRQWVDESPGIPVPQPIKQTVEIAVSKLPEIIEAPKQRSFRVAKKRNSEVRTADE